MPKYYIASGRVRLVLAADNARQAALRAFEWSCRRQAEIFAEPAGETIREAEAVDFMLDDEIQVSETGFAPDSGMLFQTVDIAARWQAPRRARSLGRL